MKQPANDEPVPADSPEQQPAGEQKPSPAPFVQAQEATPKAEMEVAAEPRTKEQELDMNVDDDEEGVSGPKPQIQTLCKSRPSFVQAPIVSSEPTKRDRLRALFLRYAEVSSETGIPSMKSRQFLKILQDAELLEAGTRLDRPRADIIYSCNTKGRRGFMTFEVFLTCLVKVAEAVLPEVAVQKRSKAVEQLISQWLLPLQEKMANQSMELQSSRSKSASDLAATTAVIVYDPAVKELLASILPILKDIYDVYFGNAFKVVKNYRQIAQTAAKQLIVFLREFDLTKNFVQKQTALVMLENLVHTPDDKLTNCKEVPAIFGDLTQDYGCYFTLSRFFVFILWVAVTGFDSTKGDPQLYTSVGTVPAFYSVRLEKVFFLLAKMELSAGFSTLYRSTPKAVSTQHSLIPPARIVTQYIVNNPLNIAGGSSPMSCISSNVRIRG